MSERRFYDCIVFSKELPELIPRAQTLYLKVLILYVTQTMFYLEIDLNLRNHYQGKVGKEGAHVYPKDSIPKSVVHNPGIYQTDLH